MTPLRRRMGTHPVLDDDDPLSGMVNLFDLAIVFAVGLIVALTLAQKSAQTAAQQAAKLPTQQSKLPVKMRSTAEKSKGPGQRIGAAYRLDSGEVVYVPESAAP
jgi:hypothetical protein